MPKKCKHQNIIMRQDSHYTIPKGWDWLNEQEDVDMNKYFVQYGETSYVCEDCAEELE